ncbi:LPS-assembly protein LptD precursor [Roseovarius albus]|uniref:LPS-assembly protein LptD n=1 Tax=Roseovarius albus TaxID=1247867 RepID=A0A1X6YDE6_9RHOB|nr:LPS assembly protein LptD [Roseovarius albus]SLN16207.1 LPS-assembly protein LptD precursor [Roseovarius albus]
MKKAAYLFSAILACTSASLAQENTVPQSNDAQAVVPQVQAAVLVADEIFLTDKDTLVASGNVEAFHGGRRLKARSITYDQRTERLHLEGPITLQEDGGTIILADAGELDRDFTRGLLTGARVIMNDQLQLAANEMRRINGRYAQLYKVSATSCKICEDGKAPLWQIRAKRLIHDQEERQLYFHDAQFRVLDVPVFYFPRLRMPDPTLDRARGFLFPSATSSTTLGTGVRTPYFIPFGDDKDLTLTPFLTDKTRTLEWRYRQAFRNGRIEFEGAYSNDDISQLDQNRAYIFGQGRFNLKNDFKLTFNIEAVTDDNYLLDYGYSDKDRLRSGIGIERARRDEYIRGGINYYTSLRADEADTFVPNFVLDTDYQRRFFPVSLPGELRFSAQAHSHTRPSDSTEDGADFDSFADGRDVSRLTTNLEWLNNLTVGNGVLAETRVALAFDAFLIEHAGDTSQSDAVELTPEAAVKLSWPLLKSEKGGATQILEPLVQLAWVGGSNPDVPNDESTITEFDEGNLFAFSRFAAPDRRERGFAASYGATWTRIDPKGWQTSFALGQVIRETQLYEPNGETSFSKTSGLQNRFSDILVSGQYRNNRGVTLTARGLIDDNYFVPKAEGRLSWQNNLVNVGLTYVWLEEDPAEDRDENISEWAIDGTYRIARHWTGSAEWRYNAIDDESIRAGVGVKYTNECVDIKLSASRRFTSTSTLEPSTDIDLTVGIRGFSVNSGDDSYTRTCRK